MGLFSRVPDADRSLSAEWTRRHGMQPRPGALALTLINRCRSSPAGDRQSWGDRLEGERLVSAERFFNSVLTQDCALAPAVARACGLFFESLGGLHVHADAALAGMGEVRQDLSPLAARSLAVARTINLRSLDQQPTASDIAEYEALYGSWPGRSERVATVGAWLAFGVARLYSGGHLNPDLPVFNDSWLDIAEIRQNGWYPNPGDARRDAAGEVGIERYWGGGDWTDRVRYREGRTWREDRHDLSAVPAE